MPAEIVRNREGVARLSRLTSRRRNSFRVAAFARNGMSFPRVAKAQPWAGIGERFQRYSFPTNLLKSGIDSTFCAKPFDGLESHKTPFKPWF
jgi:hypothetical protein